MNSALLHKYLNEAQKENFIADSDLEQAIAKYPYCASLHFFLAKSYHNQQNIKYPEAQGVAAAYASNREALYNFIYPQPEFALTDTFVEEVAPKAPVVEEKYVSIADSFRSKMAQLEAESPLADDDLEEAAFIEETDDVILVEDDSSSDFGGFVSFHESEIKEVADQEPVITESITDQQLIENDVIENNTIETQITSEPAVVEGAKELIKFNALETGVALNIDDHLPHTFTFWLRRIRHLHEPSENEKPELNEPIKKVITQNINKGFIENALHVSTFNELEDKVTVEFDLSKKEDRLIEKFIREEPTIRAVQLNEISFEDKAEKHTEDDMSMVTETMAKIYSDQHLYDKAIVVYEKLSLKFPEKKLYFATQIEKLRQLGQV